MACQVAVADLSLAIPRCECFGLLGPNGAGKTTTIRMMEGFSAASSGQVPLPPPPPPLPLLSATNTIRVFEGLHQQSAASRCLCCLLALRLLAAVLLLLLLLLLLLFALLATKMMREWYEQPTRPPACLPACPPACLLPAAAQRLAKPPYTPQAPSLAPPVAAAPSHKLLVHAQRRKGTPTHSTWANCTFAKINPRPRTCT